MASSPAGQKEDSRSDAQLVAAINAGDEQAFEALYRRYRDWVASVAYRFTGNRELALDTVQETFLYLLRQFPGFELRARLTTLLYPVAKHLAQQAARKGRREHPAIDPSAAPPEPASAGVVPQCDRSEALATLLETLPDSQREVLLLRYVDGLSQEEIATALDIPPGTVKSRLHHALRWLREDPRTKNLLLD